MSVAGRLVPSRTCSEGSAQTSACTLPFFVQNWERVGQSWQLRMWVTTLASTDHTVTELNTGRSGKPGASIQPRLALPDVACLTQERWGGNGRSRWLPITVSHCLNQHWYLRNGRWQRWHDSLKQGLCIGCGNSPWWKLQQQVMLVGTWLDYALLGRSPRAEKTHLTSLLD